METAVNIHLHGARSTARVSGDHPGWPRRPRKSWISAAESILLTLSSPFLWCSVPADTSHACVGAIVTYSADEIVPGFGMGGSVSWYSGEFAINASVLLRDPYNGNAKNFSPMGLYNMAAAYVVGGVFHVQDVGVTFWNILGYIIGIPMAAMNSRHHLWFLGDPRPIADRPVRGALFVVSRTDVYTSHGDPWWRYCPAIGIELDIALSTPQARPVGKDSSGVDITAPSLAFDFGVDKPFDFVSGGTITNPPRIFAGLRFYFARITQIRARE